MANIFKTIFDFLKKLVTRPGMKTYLNKWVSVAVEEIRELAEVNGNAAFHAWKDQAFARIKELSGEARDNWVTILIHLAYEEFKAKLAAAEPDPEG